MHLFSYTWFYQAITHWLGWGSRSVTELILNTVCRSLSLQEMPGSLSHRLCHSHNPVFSCWIALTIQWLNSRGDSDGDGSRMPSIFSPARALVALRSRTEGSQMTHRSDILVNRVKQQHKCQTECQQWSEAAHCVLGRHSSLLLVKTCFWFLSRINRIR